MAEEIVSLTSDCPPPPIYYKHGKKKIIIIKSLTNRLRRRAAKNITREAIAGLSFPVFSVRLYRSVRLAFFGDFYLYPFPKYFLVCP